MDNTSGALQLICLFGSEKINLRKPSQSGKFNNPNNFTFN